MRNIPCEFEISIYNTLCSRGPPKVLAESRKNACGGHLLFQNEAKNIPRQDFMVMNISCKFEKASYNIFFVRAVLVKSLYTLWRQRRWLQRNKAKSIVSHFFIFRKNPRWPPKVAKIENFPLLHRTLLYYPVGQKLARNRSISYGFRNIHTFSFFAKIQDGRQKW